MSEKKGLIHSLEKFVFLVKRRIKKAKLKASGKPQYTVSQLKIFQQLQPGDLILGKMPMSDRKLYEVPDGHRHRPYLVLRKNKKTVTCLQGSHKTSVSMKALVISAPLNITNYQLKTSISLSDLSVRPRNRRWKENC